MGVCERETEEVGGGQDILMAQIHFLSSMWNDRLRQISLEIAGVSLSRRFSHEVDSGV